MEENKSIRERVQEIATINFSITKCPHAVYQDFTDFCKAETNDNYSMGLKLLLEAKRTNIKEIVLFEQYMVLKNEFEELKQKFAEIQQKPEIKAKLKTFGGKKDTENTESKI